MQGAEGPEGAATRRRVTRWLWRAPVYLVGALIALAVALLLLVLVGDAVYAAVRAVGVLPLTSAIIIVGTGPLVLAATVAAGDRLPGEQNPKPSSQDRVLWLVLGVGVAAVAYGVSQVALRAGANHPGGAYCAALISAVVALAVAVVATGSRRAQRPRLERLIPRMAPVLAIPAAIVLAAALVGAYGGEQNRSGPDGQLNLYCRYGAVSSAQLDGCLDHVRVSDIPGLHTDAARFAEGRLRACLADAGPFCAHALLIATEVDNVDPSDQ
jgi:hypothetical protein